MKGDICNLSVVGILMERSSKCNGYTLMSQVIKINSVKTESSTPGAH